MFLLRYQCDTYVGIKIIGAAPNFGVKIQTYDMQVLEKRKYLGKIDFNNTSEQLIYHEGY